MHSRLLTVVSVVQAFWQRLPRPLYCTLTSDRRAAVMQFPGNLTRALTQCQLITDGPVFVGMGCAGYRHSNSEHQNSYG
jgi:hypothetical protein